MGKAELRGILAAATPETWETERWDLDSGEFHYHIKAIYTDADGSTNLALIGTTENDLDHPKAKADATLMVAARNGALEQLLDRVDVLEVELSLRESRAVVAPLVARELEADDGIPRGGCPHVSRGMCERCTFDWAMNELKRLRARVKALEAALHKAGVTPDGHYRHTGFDQLEWSTSPPTPNRVHVVAFDADCGGTYFGFATPTESGHWVDLTDVDCGDAPSCWLELPVTKGHPEAVSATRYGDVWVKWYGPAVVWTWPPTPGQEAIWSALGEAEPGITRVIAFGPPGEGYCITSRELLMSSVEDVVGDWDDGEEIAVRLGWMTDEDFEKLPEFEGF